MPAVHNRLSFSVALYHDCVTDARSQICNARLVKLCAVLSIGDLLLSLLTTTLIFMLLLCIQLDSLSPHGRWTSGPTQGCISNFFFLLLSELRCRLSVHGQYPCVGPGLICPHVIVTGYCRFTQYASKGQAILSSLFRVASCISLKDSHTHHRYYSLHSGLCLLNASCSLR